MMMMMMMILPANSVNLAALNPTDPMKPELSKNLEYGQSLKTLKP